MVLGIPGGLETLVMSRESTTLSALKARLTPRTSDALHLVAQLSGLFMPLLAGRAGASGMAKVGENTRPCLEALYLIR